MIVKHDQRVLRATAHQRLHQILVHKLRALDADGIPFLMGADVEQPHRFAALAAIGKVFWGDLHLPVQFMAALDVFNDFGHIEIVAARTKAAQSFGHLKSATAAPADVIFAKQRPPRAWKGGEDVLHGGLWGKRHCNGH